MPQIPRVDICGNSDVAATRRGVLYDKTFPQQTITQSTNLDQKDHDTVWVVTDDGDVEVNLPDPAVVLAKEFTVKKVNVGGGVCTVLGTIDNFTDMVLDDFASITVKSIGGQWMIVSSHRIPTF